MAGDEQLRFDGQVAIVTGGAGAIGSAHVRLLAQRGARVLVNDAGVNPDGTRGDEVAEASWTPSAISEDAARLQQTVATGTSAAAVVEEVLAAGGEAIADTHDAVSEADGIVEAALAAWGRVDVVIANAAVVRLGPFGDISMEDFEACADSSYRGSTRIAHAAWAELAKTRGRILLTSAGAMLGVKYLSAYSSSKAAVMALGRALAFDGEEHGIRVNSIMPFAASRFGRSVPGLAEFAEQHYPAERVADASLWLVHKSTEVTGETFSVGGGFAGRVTVGVGWGWADRSATPEDYRAHAADIRRLDQGIMFPRDGGEELNFRSDRALGWHLDGETLH
jgi:NAD(P)-dependent dehydrogenase (short-subunit alcohol dehydrogenase family)